MAVHERGDLARIFSSGALDLNDVRTHVGEELVQAFYDQLQVVDATGMRVVVVKLGRQPTTPAG